MSWKCFSSSAQHSTRIRASCYACYPESPSISSVRVSKRARHALTCSRNASANGGREREDPGVVRQHKAQQVEDKRAGKRRRLNPLGCLTCKHGSRMLRMGRALVLFRGVMLATHKGCAPHTEPYRVHEV